MEGFQFMFVNMGQGDCAIVKCPNNKVVMVDCGSASGLMQEAFDQGQETLNAWLGGQPLEAMIFTHPDKDHYNQTTRMVVNPSTNTFIPISNLYFSMALSDASPLGSYSQNDVAAHFYAGSFGHTTFREVTINSAVKRYKEWLWGKVPVVKDIATPSLEIMSGKTASGQDWKISILAGNVTTPSKTDSEISNTASLVTLFESGTEKVLLTGDSTQTTQQYLYDTYKGGATISDVSVVQIPHHGSSEHISSDVFVGMVNPQAFYISVGLLNDSFAHPRFTVISQWHKAGRLQPFTSHAIDYWKSPGEFDGPVIDVKSIVAGWKSKGYAVENNASGKFFWLQDPSQAGSSFYGIRYNGFTLYRVAADKSILETGINGFVAYPPFKSFLVS